MTGRHTASYPGTGVTVFGTEGDDQFIFSAADARSVRINGAACQFVDSEVKLVQFDAGPGDDRVELRDSSGNETLEAWATEATLSNGAGDTVADFP